MYPRYIDARCDDEIISQFVLPEKRARYRFAMPRDKHRHYVLVQFFSRDEIDPRSIAGDGNLASFMDSTGQKLNTKYYIWSWPEVGWHLESGNWELSWREAMRAANDLFCILIYCPRLKVSYYKGEHGSEYHLRKPVA